MKVIHLNQSDSKGGAAIAAYRVHRALLGRSVSSEFWVDVKYTDDPTVKEKLNSVDRVFRKIVAKLEN